MACDLIIIGGGPAGYGGALRAGALGLGCVLFEQNDLGGVCLSEGCIPSKALLRGAKLADTARFEPEYFGLDSGALNYAHGAAMEKKERVISLLRRTVERRLADCGVEVRYGRAEITERRGDVFQVKSEGAEYSARNVLIASGSRQAVPCIPGLADSLNAGSAVTTRSLLGMTELPGSVNVLGAGAAGLESASWLTSCGCEVTVTDIEPAICASWLEPAMSLRLADGLSERGIHFCLGKRVLSVEGGSVLLEGRRLDSDMLLLAAGRLPDASGTGVGALLTLNNGAIPVNERQMTAVPDLYAAGDVLGRAMQAHTAFHEAEVAVNNIAGIPDIMSYDIAPKAVYCDPEAAAVGETAASLKLKNAEPSVLTRPMRVSGRYIIEYPRQNGLATLITEPGGVIRGGQIVGGPASELISILSVAISARMTVSGLKKIIFPHPAISEVFGEF